MYVCIIKRKFSSLFRYKEDLCIDFFRKRYQPLNNTRTIFFFRFIFVIACISRVFYQMRATQVQTMKIMGRFKHHHL